MTEENKDSNPRRLRLSRQPNDAGTEGQAEGTPKPEESAVRKSNLRLKRADSEIEPKESKPEPKEAEPKEAEPEEAEPRPAETEQAEAPAPSPSAGTPAQSQPEAKPHEAKPVEAPDDRAFDPENPFKRPVDEPKAATVPPALPSNPRPPADYGSPQKARKAIGEPPEEKKNKGLVASVIVILGLLALLGACGYGLYYVLQEPSGNNESASNQESAAQKEESGSFLSQPIEKAKAVISKVPDQGAALPEEKTSAPAESPPQEAKEPDPAEAAGPAGAENKPSAASLDSSQTSSVAAFLQAVHVGGTRTGERPKLILNGQSYEKGDIVDPSSGLRFIGFRNKKIAFQDTQGIVYIKSF